MLRRSEITDDPKSPVGPLPFGIQEASGAGAIPFFSNLLFLIAES